MLCSMYVCIKIFEKEYVKIGKHIFLPVNYYITFYFTSELKDKIRIYAFICYFILFINNINVCQKPIEW